MEVVKQCSGCAAALPADAPEGLCPQCLLKQGLEVGSANEVPTVLIGEKDVRGRALPMPGEQFGGYHIVSELGRGGMGAVYEAEHLESRRRVALKVLSQQLDSPSARARFLREGRLAASINHPNSVYVYGTEEIEGIPTIAMELIAGGTLQERVQQNGPLPVGEAVDAILQVIAGLEAAHAIGILHRDIKPSNCFRDTEGTVKIGDFGLSISTAARAETSLTLQGAFLGTPMFCSPEQLRGEALDARSDLYSVGITLFYLLTGHTPFEGKHIVQLLATVLDQPAPSPRKFQPKLPLGLAGAVLKCLAKQAGERFKNYEELRLVLSPFSSDAPVPAAPAVRFAAGVVDMLVLYKVVLNAAGSALRIGQTDAATFVSTQLLRWMFSQFLLTLVYYTILEGFWGASLGKWICRLCVTGPDRNPAGIGRAFFRAFIFVLVPALPFWIAAAYYPMLITNRSLIVLYVPTLISCLVLALLFGTMRRCNGFAGLHDLLTKTRVVRKPAHLPRPILPTNAEVSPTSETRRLGPYHVLEDLAKKADHEWLLGFDTRLLRRVWLRVVSAGTPPVPVHLRNLSRVGRLRWITGRRSAEENWDAFEAVSGKPLANLIARRQSWSQVRLWLMDLAVELASADKDGTRPEVLGLDRVWISADGRAKLLDFPAPGAVCPDLAGARDSGETRPLSDWSSEVFLNQIARAALEGRSINSAELETKAVSALLPLHAQNFLHKLPTMPGAGAVSVALKPLMQQVPTVSRLRRIGLIVGCIAFPWLAAPLLTLTGGVLFYDCIPALIAALLFRGGLVLRLLGVAVVLKDGAPASRLRVFWRGLVTWVPIVLLMLAWSWSRRGMPNDAPMTWSSLLPSAALFGLAIWSVALPERSLQDRLAGTSLVPR
jgi:tRNA A-37 threonylcarbamoyl transferase component Bud32